MISLAARRVEVAGRLVGEEQRRLGDDRARDRDALLLAAGELAGRVLLPAGQARPTPSAARASRRRSLGRDAAIDQRQLDVLERRGARQQVEALEDEAEIVPAKERALVASRAPTSTPRKR